MISGEGPAARAVARASNYAWPLLQGTAAATLAWVVAKYGLGHEQPFFAPVAAIVGLYALDAWRLSAWPRQLDLPHRRCPRQQKVPWDRVGTRQCCLVPPPGS